MAGRFLDQLGLIIDASSGGVNSTESNRTCERQLNESNINLFILIPAVLITLSFAVTKKRRRILLSLWDGRPGLAFPMDALTRSSRISYACAFGATAYLVYEIVLHQKYAINYTAENKAVKSLIILLSTLIYGMVFFPLFTSLAIGSVYGYAVGSLYVWMLTAVEIYKVFHCDSATAEERGLLILRGLPAFLCLFYLCVTIPVRILKARRQHHFFDWKGRDQEEEAYSLSDTRASYPGRYVANLFRKPRVKPPRETPKGRIVDRLIPLVHRFVYRRKRGFCYPTRIISVLVTAVLVIYMSTFETLAVIPRLLDSVREALTLHLKTTIGTEQVANETQADTDRRTNIIVAIYLLFVLKVCAIVSTVLAAVCSLMNVLHTLSSYRANLLALYRGDHSHIPPASVKSNTSHCVGSIKYAGYQVGYIIWAYLIQGSIFLLLSFFCAMIIIAIMHDFDFWIVQILQSLWPFVVTFVVVYGAHYLLSKFVFLQNRGQFLALDNRSVFFNYTYFMFFYNIFLGLFSCFVRILKALVLGIFFLSRLDSSTLSRRFEFLDPGFKAYVGYMQMEAAHTHPVLIVFCRLMLLGLGEKREREEERERRGNRERTTTPTSLRSSTCDQIELIVTDSPGGIGPYGDNGNDNPASVTTTSTSDLTEKEHRRRVAARFHWHVTYTLLHNPEIRVMRKGYLQMLRQARSMGIHIPVWDRQADVNVEQLQERLADAREKLHPASRKKAHSGFDKLEERVAGVGNSAAKKAGALAARVKRMANRAGLGDAPHLASEVPKQERAAHTKDLPAPSVQTRPDNPAQPESVDMSTA